MGLYKLLAVGRSVRSITGQQSRYKMTQQNLLPTFGGAKAAEASDVGTVSTAPQTVANPLPVDREEQSATAVMNTPARGEPRPDKAAAFVEATKNLRPFGGGAWFKNPFARSTPDNTERGPIQTELSLDAVRPVRNDLSEPDAELGRAPARDVVRADALQAQRVDPAPPATATVGLWQRLKRRLFGVTDTN